MRAVTNPTPTTPPPIGPGAVVDRYFLEHRAKALDIAAFLDRVDRASAANATTCGWRSGPNPLRAAAALYWPDFSTP